MHAADSKPLLMKFQNKIFWKSRLVANSQWIFYEIYGETEKKYFIRKYINKKNNNPSDIKMWEI